MASTLRSPGEARSASPVRAPSQHVRGLIASCIVLVTALAWAYLVHLNRHMTSPIEGDTMMAAMGMVMNQPWSAGDLLLTCVAQERLVRDDPKNPDQRQSLGGLLAHLGRKAEARAQGERAFALARATGDVDIIDYMRVALAGIYVRIGDHDAALAHLDTVLRGPSKMNPGRLREDFDYAPLRRNPRFERLLARHEVMAPNSPSD